MRLPDHTSKIAKTIAILAIAAFATACGKKSQRSDTLVSDKDPVLGLMAHIPADTAYAFVSLSPLPLEIVYAWYDRFAPLQSMSLGFSPDDATLPLALRAFAAVQEEMTGGPDRFKEIGLSTSPRISVHGLGLLPVVRMDLGDPQRFLAFVERVETRIGVQGMVETHEGHEFRSYSAGDKYLIFAVHNRQVVFGYAPARSAARFAPLAIGAELPSPSMADDDQLKPIATSYNYEKVGTGFVDLRRLFNQAAEEGTSVHHEIRGEPLMQLPPECVTEAKRLLNAAPRIVFGYRDITEKSLHASGGLELTGDLGVRLGATKLPAPAFDTEYVKSAPIAAAIGVNVDALLNVVSEEATRAQRQPFTCPMFRELNQVAEEVNNVIYRLPAIVRNLRGAAIALTSADEDGKNMQGVGVVNSANSDALLSFLRTFAPEFEHVTPDPSGIPFRLPEQEMLRNLADPHIVLTAESLAITAGDAATSDALSAIATPPTATALLLVRYNFKRLQEVLPSTRHVSMDFLGDTTMAFDANEAGLFVDYHLQFD